jgi:hypothetical protein
MLQDVSSNPTSVGINALDYYYWKRSVLDSWLVNGGVPALNDIIVLMMIIVQMQL